ncbi:hypothetical protein BDV10DRAFT_189277 [Aspergillus recurvatus]
MDIVGVTGDFVVREEEVDMLLVARGIGITPFLAILSALSARRKVSARGHVVLVLSTREPNVLLNLFEPALGNVPSTIRFKLDLFTTRSIDLDIEKFSQENVHTSVHKGRIGAEYWKAVSKDKDVFICGPNAFGDAAVDSLRAAGVPNEEIQREGFY